MPKRLGETGAESAPLEPWTWDPALDDGAGDQLTATPGILAAVPPVEVDDRSAFLQPDRDAPADQVVAPSKPAEVRPEPLAPLAAPLQAERTFRRRRASRRAERAQSRVTIRHVDVLTVARVSLLFYLLVLVMVVVASLLLYYAANAFGSLDSIEKSVRTLFDLKSFTLHPQAVAKYTAAGGAVLALAGTLLNVLAALSYNLICDIVGGFRIEVESTLPGSPANPD